MTTTADLILARCRLRAQRQMLWTEVQWARGRTSADQGLAITPGEVARILQSPAATQQELEEFRARPDVAALTSPIAAADEALGRDPGWHRLCAQFAIPAQDQDLLALALAEALDPEFGRALAYFHDDVRQSKATLWIAAVLGSDAPDAITPGLAGETLLRWRLVTPTEPLAALLLATPVQAERTVVNAVLTGAWSDERLLGMATVQIDPGIAALPVLHGEALSRMTAIGQNAAISIDLLGDEGIGRGVLAAQFAAATNRRLLVVDAAALVASAAPNADLIVGVLRMARATGSTILWRHAEKLLPDAIPADLSAGLGMIRCLPAEAITRPGAIGIALEKPALAARRAIWQYVSDDPPPPILTTQRLTPGEIALIAEAAPGGNDAIRLALRRTTPPDGDMLSRLHCPYGWEDLIAPAELMAQLQELESHIRLRWDVYENWGFSRLAHLGTGIAALFAGPSGTGKTMAAQILAAALDLDLYRVDLAGVVNKYIGETEKRLRDVFAFGERSGVILFFDEADALFGNRTQVKDSHDRFANIEIDYLLQRIERFDGIAILATNRKSDLDSAFMRRLRFVVDFIPPGPRESIQIWQRALPMHAPGGAALLDEIDWHLLADRLQFSGAEIKSAALAAAFLARGEGCRIGMRHILAAAQRELAKRGHALRLRPTAVAGST
jgi:ATPase family associated with various cellular activities (AAA)